MPEKDPANYSLFTYLWVVALASWGGAVGFYRKMKDGRARPFNIVEFIGEVATSALVGVITFWLCEASGVNQLLSAALIAISGHMGSRAIWQFEKWAERRLMGDSSCEHVSDK